MCSSAVLLRWRCWAHQTRPRRRLCCGGFRASRERLADLAACAGSLYPPGPAISPRIQPDLVGEWFVVSQLAADPTLARSLRDGITDEQAARALGLLARAADHLSQAVILFEDFLSGDAKRLVLAAVRAAMTGQTVQRLIDPAIAARIRAAGWTLDELAKLQTQIPDHVLLETQVTLADLTVSANRELAATNPAVHRPDLAHALDSLSISLQRLGEDRGALPVAEEAVALCRELAASNPAAHRPDLARALHNLCAALDWVGENRDALAAAQEAVALYRELAASNPAVHRLNLAHALGNLAASLGQLGRKEDALAARTETVDLYRDLVDKEASLYSEQYRRKLAALRREYDQRGMSQDAIRHHLAPPPT
jgi:tetratricopeptide (TPR) repeat protein